MKKYVMALMVIGLFSACSLVQDEEDFAAGLIDPRLVGYWDSVAEARVYHADGTCQDGIWDGFHFTALSEAQPWRVKDGQIINRLPTGFIQRENLDFPAANQIKVGRTLYTKLVAP